MIYPVFLGATILGWGAISVVMWMEAMDLYDAIMGDKRER